MPQKTKALEVQMIMALTPGIIMKKQMSCLFIKVN